MKMFVVVGAAILADIISGLLCAGKNGKIDSTKLRSGLFSKAGEILTMVGAYAINYYLSINLVEPVGIYIAAMEAISIIENICVVSPTLSKLFAPYLAKLNEVINPPSKEENTNGNEN